MASQLPRRAGAVGAAVMVACSTLGLIGAGPVGSSSFPGENGKIAFTSSRTGNGEIFVMNSDGTSQTNLTNGPGGDGQPSWSADGRQIAFVSDRGAPSRSMS